MARIAVAGAGIAGLGAAYILQKTGHQVTVFEREDHVGGRMLTRSENGFTWEPGAQFMLSGYSAMRALMSEVGVAMASTPIPATSASLLPNGKLHYQRVDGPTAALSHPSLSFGTKLRMGKVLMEAMKHKSQIEDFHHPERAAPIDTESLRAWGDREIGKDAVDFVLSVPASTFFFWRPDETPWWIPVSFVHMLSQSQAMVPAGGMCAVPAALAAQLDVRLSTPVLGIDLNDDGTATLRLDGGEFTADRVIVATPAPTALALLADPDAALGSARANYLRGASYARNVTTAIAYRAAPEQRSYGVGFPTVLNRPLAAIGWDHMKGPDRAPAGAGLAVVMPTNAHSIELWDKDEDTIEDDLLAAVNAVYPGSRNGALFTRITRWEHAMPLMPPGRARDLAAALSVGRTPNSLIFTCGDYWMGPSVEQALATGQNAAAEVMRSLTP
jgi:oxygen-dependent protoporphyrinogen oxidase